MNKIKIIAAGGGISLLDRVISSGLSAVDFIAADYDVAALKKSQAPVKIELKSIYSHLIHESAKTGSGIANKS